MDGSRSRYALIVILLSGPLLGRGQGLPCTECHPKATGVRSSAHADLSCTDCHTNVEGSPHSEPLPPLPTLKMCVSCHKESFAVLVQGAHSDLACEDCHGSGHKISIPALFKPQIPQTCGTCHEDEHHRYVRSIHWEAYRKGNDDAPLCTDCHGEHRILAADDTTSPIYPAHVPQTCTACHDDVRITSRYSLPPGRLRTYMTSYHGIALRSGILTAATCVSCHNAHEIRPSSDPWSSTHPLNLVKTCGKCHPGASEAFVRGKIHVEARPEVSPGVFAVRTFYTIFIGLLAFFFLVHILLDAKKHLGRKKEA